MRVCCWQYYVNSMSCTTKHRNMFPNIQPARNEDHYYYAGKYHYNKVPHHTEAHRPLESCNRSYNKSNHVRFSKTNTLSHTIQRLGHIWLPDICLHSLINLASHNKGISQNFISFYFGSTLVLILGGNRLVTEKGSSYWLMNVIVFISLLWLSWWRWYQTNKKCDVDLII